MSKKSSTSWSLRIANTFGVLGYGSVLLQWLWMALTIVLPLLVGSQALDFFLPRETAPTAPIEAGNDFSPVLQVIIAVLAVVFSVAVSLYALYKLPKSIGKAGKTITHTGAKVSSDFVAKRAHYQPAQKARLMSNITWAAKFVLIALPLLALLLPTAEQFALNHLQVVVVGLFLSVWSLVWFIAQLILAHVAKLSSKTVW